MATPFEQFCWVHGKEYAVERPRREQDGSEPKLRRFYFPDGAIWDDQHGQGWEPSRDPWKLQNAMRCYCRAKLDAELQDFRFYANSVLEAKSNRGLCGHLVPGIPPHAVEKLLAGRGRINFWFVELTTLENQLDAFSQAQVSPEREVRARRKAALKVEWANFRAQARSTFCALGSPPTVSEQHNGYHHEEKSHVQH